MSVECWPIVCDSGPTFKPILAECLVFAGMLIYSDKMSLVDDHPRQFGSSTCRNISTDLPIILLITILYTQQDFVLQIGR